MIGRKERRGALRPWFHRLELGLVILIFVAGVSPTALAARMRQMTFATPESAVDALIAANRNNQTEKLLHILGPHSGRLIFSGDLVADKQGRARFLRAYDAVHQLESNGENKRILVVGKEAWPLPIPIVRTDEGWRFDTLAGEQEILNRRIGRNELSVVHVCRAYVEAQREFAEIHQEAGGKPEYARQFRSTKGKHNGLYWQRKAGATESPLGPLIAAAEAEGYGEAALRAKRPYHGYFYKILTAQGEGAAGGARSYLIDNRMTNGFALIAFPAKYGDSGVMTFMVNQDGIVYEKDLGPKTTRIAGQMRQYDLDATWKIYKPVHP
jgi:hypothetical protein